MDKDEKTTVEKAEVKAVVEAVLTVETQVTTGLTEKEESKVGSGEVSVKHQAEREVALVLERNAGRMTEVRRFEEAHDLMRQAVQIYRKIGDRESLGYALLRHGYSFQQQQKLTEALECYSEAKECFEKLEDKKNFGICCDRIAKSHYWQGKLLDAAKEYEEAVAFGSENSEIFNNLAFIQIELEKFEEAEKNLQKALEIREKEESNETHITLNNLGVIKYIKGDYKKAAELFALGVEKDKREPKEDRSIQYVVFLKPEYKKETFKNFISFNDVDTKASLKLNLAAALGAAGKMAEALKLVEEALEMDKDQPYLYEAAGWFYLNYSDEKKAVNYFKRALPFDPTNEDLRKIIYLINPYIDAKVGRNDPCPCGSGKKFKKCHGSSI